MNYLFILSLLCTAGLYSMEMEYKVIKGKGSFITFRAKSQELEKLAKEIQEKKRQGIQISPEETEKYNTLWEEWRSFGEAPANEEEKKAEANKKLVMFFATPIQFPITNERDEEEMGEYEDACENGDFKEKNFNSMNEELL